MEQRKDNQQTIENWIGNCQPNYMGCAKIKREVLKDDDLLVGWLRTLSYGSDDVVIDKEVLDLESIRKKIRFIANNIKKKGYDLEETYDQLSSGYGTSAREYFMVLRLAILHVTGDNIETSFQVAQYEKSKEIYEAAIKILKALNR